ncbi:unnamed protein product, partial [Effrenium voratum]
RTAVALVPAVLQLETGSQAWDAAASRRDKTEWQGLAAPGADGTFGANAAALPRNFREVSDLLAPHRLVLKHSAAKAAEPTLWRRGAPTRKLRRSARLEAGVGRGFLST